MANNVRNFIVVRLITPLGKVIGESLDFSALFTGFAASALIVVSTISIVESARASKMLSDDENEAFPMLPMDGDLQRFGLMELEEQKTSARYLAGVIRQQLATGSLSRMVLVLGPNPLHASAMVRQALVPMGLGRTKNGVAILPVGKVVAGWPSSWLPAQRINVGASLAWLDTKLWVARIATGVNSRGPLFFLKKLLNVVSGDNNGDDADSGDFLHQLVGPAVDEERDASQVLGSLFATFRLALRGTAVYRGIAPVNVVQLDQVTQQPEVCSSFVLQQRSNGGVIVLDGCDRLMYLARKTKLGEQALQIVMTQLVDLCRDQSAPSLSHVSVLRRMLSWLFPFLLEDSKPKVARCAVMVIDDALLLRYLIPIAAREGIQVISYGDLSRKGALEYYKRRLMTTFGKMDEHGDWFIAPAYDSFYLEALEIFPEVYELVGGRIPDLVAVVHHFVSNRNGCIETKLPLKDLLYTFPDISACDRFLEPVLFAAQANESVDDQVDPTLPTRGLSSLWAPLGQTTWNPQWTRREAILIFKTLLTSPTVVPWVDLVTQSGQTADSLDPRAVVSLVSHGILWYRPAGLVYNDVPNDKGVECPLTNVNALRDCVAFHRPLLRFCARKQLERYASFCDAISLPA